MLRRLQGWDWLIWTAISAVFIGLMMSDPIPRHVPAQNDSQIVPITGRVHNESGQGVRARVTINGVGVNTDAQGVYRLAIALKSDIAIENPIDLRDRNGVPFQSVEIQERRGGKSKVWDFAVK